VENEKYFYCYGFVILRWGFCGMIGVDAVNQDEKLLN
jgi:hypothetical protein